MNYKMQYLKLFEMNSLQYEEIDQEVYVDIISNNTLEEFRDSETVKIKDVFDRRSSYRLYHVDQGLFTFRYRQNDIVILKMTDDWFIVRFCPLGDSDYDYEYYKCDEIEGVLNCLKKEFEIE